MQNLKTFIGLWIIYSFIGFNLLGQSCNLPTEFSFSNREANDRAIAQCFAPVIHQMAERGLEGSVNGRADLITAVKYDGNWDCRDNWDNLANFESGPTISIDALDPYVYYSVIWTNTFWIITYGFYHPRDYASQTSPCCADNHENDFEGVILVVAKAAQTVLGVATITHSNLNIYSLVLNFPPPNVVPEIFIDNGTHAVEANIGNNCITDFINICDDCMDFSLGHIVYTPSLNGNAFVDANPLIRPGGTSSINLVGTGEYILEDIFGDNPNSLHNLRNNPNVFSGSKFASGGSVDCQNQGTASAPWGWEQFLHTEREIESLICRTVHFGICDTHFQGFFNIDIIHNPYFPEGCTQETLIVSEDSDWNFPSNKEFHKIIIDSYVNLNVSNKTIKMANGGSIEIKKGATLSLNNAIITSCDEKWEGIKINSSCSDWIDGDPCSPYRSKIEMKNQSRIENADIGIHVDLKEDIEEGSYLFYLDCDFSRFIDNRIAIKIEEGITSGKIKNCFFTNNTDVAIDVGNNTGLFIEGANITGSKVGIKSTDSHIRNIYGCYIDGATQQGILAEGTFPLASGINIGNADERKNFFHNNNVGIFISGCDYPSGVQVVNNDILGSSQALYASGINKYNFKNNKVNYNYYGLIAWAAGDNFNQISCNDYLDNTGPHENLFFLDNRRSTVLENQFTLTTNTVQSNIAVISGQINSDIGSPENSASNCFSSLGNDISTGSIFNWPHWPFKYHYYDDSNTSNCQEPENPVGYSIFQSLQPGNYCDGQIGVFNLIDPDGDGVLGVPHILTPTETGDPVRPCFDCVRDSVLQWITILIQLGGDNPNTEIDDEVYTGTGDPIKRVYAEEVLDQWINYGLYEAIQSENWNFAEQLLTPLKKWRWQSRLFGIKMIRKNYIAAANILDAMPEADQNQIYFKDIQRINLKRLYGYQGEQRITQAEIAHLRTIAESIYPVSGYARSLYHILEGELISFTMPAITIDRVTPRSVQTQEKERKIMVYPNPAQDQLTISSVSKSIIMGLKLYNIEGTKLIDVEVNTSAHILDISNVKKGLHLLQILTSDGIVLTEKVFIY